MASDAVAGDAAQIFLQQIVQSGRVFLQLKKSAARPAAQMYRVSRNIALFFDNSRTVTSSPGFKIAEGISQRTPLTMK